MLLFCLILSIRRPHFDPPDYSALILLPPVLSTPNLMLQDVLILNEHVIYSAFLDTHVPQHALSTLPFPGDGDRLSRLTKALNAQAKLRSSHGLAAVLGLLVSAFSECTRPSPWTVPSCIPQAMMAMGQLGSAPSPWFALECVCHDIFNRTKPF